ncbi:MAG: hypothetical protein ACMUIE_01875 [Thermoplasmatota archaeon]
MGEPPFRQGGNKLTAEQKLQLKKYKKKKELVELYKKGKISQKQYITGMRKLGYSDDIEKALEFKKFIKEQIRAFEKMEVGPPGSEGGYHFDPNESKAELPRDEHGNVITDFSVSPRPASAESRTAPPMVTINPQGAPRTVMTRSEGGGPIFGDSLFGRGGDGTSSSKSQKKEIPKATLVMDKPGQGGGKKRTRLAELEWDEDEEEEEEEEFEIDLSDGEGAGESGWWDDDDWELEWSDEDEDEWESWEDEIEEDEWEAVWDDEGEGEEDQDDEEDDGEDEFVIEEGEEPDGGGNEEDDDEVYWGEPRRIRRSNF